MCLHVVQTEGRFPLQEARIWLNSFLTHLCSVIRLSSDRIVTIEQFSWKFDLIDAF